MATSYNAGLSTLISAYSSGIGLAALTLLDASIAAVTVKAMIDF
jgi:hypothetical protein